VAKGRFRTSVIVSWLSIMSVCSQRSVVSPTSRRIFLYWLLLLVPTLVVGGAAILLLQRERDRVARQGAYAEEARRAAVAARARLVVETVELIVGDVQSGLLDVLAAEPEAGLEDFMERWERNNPLVRTAFRAAIDGRVLRPDAQRADENGRGFIRRLAQPLRSQPPWVLPAPSVGNLSLLKQEASPMNDESAARQEISKNVAQAQSARRDVQDLLRGQSGLASADSAPAEVRDAFAAADAAKPARVEAERVAAGARPTEKEGTSSTVFAGSFSGRSPSPASAPLSVRSESKVNERPAAPARLLAKDTADRRGWQIVSGDGRAHLIGWVQREGARDVRGVELNLGALVGRLGGALPADAGEGEGYALRDEQGRILHQSGALADGVAAAVRVPLAAALLPGWEVTGHLAPLVASTGAGDGMLGVGVLLVGIFVAAILAGGSLLLWQARRSDEEAAQKTSFVANVSHEFKTPLTTIRLYSELLEQGRVRDQAQSSEYLRTIGRETQRLARLVNNALDFSRLEQGRKKYARDTVDLTTELNALLDTHAPRVAEAGLVLRRELPPGAVSVTTDRDAFGQIVLNLIDNACKYASDGGEVSVGLAPGPGGGAVVRVADRGPGVPSEHRERIFEKFHRVDDALTAEKTGAGLGLSIARQLARGLGGDLRYVARAGAGAEFVLELP
jgi:two-component system phosphate regulon sensor histidine kinase PhoR